MLIAVGMFLLTISAVRGATIMIALVNGLPLSNYSNIRLAIINTLFNFVIPIAGGVLLILAGIMLLDMHQVNLIKQVNNNARRRITHERLKMLDAFLNEGEKRTLEIIKEHDGRVLQSELMSMSGFSKVKVHRILKKLEAQGIIRRSRFGITNSVMLSYEEGPQISAKT